MEKQIKEIIRSVIREEFISEMSKNDIHVKEIMKFYDKGSSNAKKALSLYLLRKPYATRNQIIDELGDYDYNEIWDVMDHFKLKLEGVKEYVDDKGVEHVAAALPQTEEEPVNEEKPGLWANIRAKRARGEEPAHKNSQAHKDAVKAGKEINKNEVVDDEEKSPEEVLNGLTEMAMGDLERIEDYAEMISDRMKEGQELSSWMYSQITLAVDQLNSVHDAMDGKDGVKESVTEALVKGKTYGGSKCEGGCFVGKTGLMKIIKISKDSPKDVFMFRQDNFSGLQPHFIKNGVIAKATVINPAYDLEKHKVRNLKIGNDVILSVRLFVSTNESVTECKTCNSK